MGLYRKKPVVIEAERFDGQREIAGVVISPVLEPTPANPTGVYGQIQTLEGVMTCIVGDMVITGVKGERYPCKPDIFAATYEEVNARPIGPGTPDDLLDYAWSIIANAGGGDWTKETKDWQEAAAKWRESYHQSAPRPQPAAVAGLNDGCRNPAHGTPAGNPEFIIIAPSLKL